MKSRKTGGIIALLLAVLLLTPMTAYGISAVLTEPQSYAFGSVKPQFVAANHVLMLRADGRLFGWGDNSRGQLGLGAGADRQYAEAVELVYFKDKAIKQILAIKDASYVLLQNGEVYSCGSGANGRLGQGRLDDLNTWTQIPNSVSLGIFSLYGNCNSASVFAITADDSLLACGKNDVGQLGINSTADALNFTKVMDYADIKSLHIGENFAALIKMDGTAMAAGDTSSYKTGTIPYTVSQYYYATLGSGDDRESFQGTYNYSLSKPLPQQMFVYFEQIPIPTQRTMYAIHATRTCDNKWGNVCYERTPAIGAAKNVSSIAIPAFATASFIQYGNAHGIMKRADGSYIGWGDVKKKQLLGQTDVTDGVVLTALNDKIAELTSQGYNDFKVQVAGDSNYLIASNAAAKLYKTFGWGSNTRGKLGVNSEQASFNVLTELPTLNGINVEQIVAGIGNVFFITDKGDVWATGNNAFGQLGLGVGFGGMTVNTPTLVPNVKWSEKALPPIINSVTVSTEWGSANTIAIAATGYGGGSMEYAVTGSNTTAPTVGWQSSASFAMSANGKYYAWARDNVGLVSTPFEFTVTKVDTVSPVISGVTVPQEWGKTSTIAIAAIDVESGIKEYAISGSNTTAPTAGWQSSASFTLDKNGTYYAWARDKANNVSLPFTLAVTKVDAVSPVISGVTVPQEWGKTSTIAIAATDGESGLKEYAISGSKTTAPPVGWQSSASFTLDKNGTYYAWARDKANNVSLPFTLAVTKVDTVSPVISGVTVPQEWSKTSNILIAATDGESGIKEYAISGSKTTAPTVGRQSSAEFSLSTNGKYYAWVWDNAGNVSLPIEFVVNKVDAYQPSISKVTIAPGYSGSIAVDIEAADKGSGLKDYAVTTENLAPEPSGTWQTGSSFTLDKNGTYYAWARDNVGLVSSGWFFSITKVDKKPPTLSQTTFNSDSTLMMVRASDYESGVKCIYIDGAEQAGDMVSWNVPAGTRYIKIQAEDNAGNKTAELTQRVPGWFDVLDTITLEPVKFIEDNKKATVTAKTTEGDSIVGIYINGRLQRGNPVTYMIPYGTEYLELQAQNAVSDRSAIYRVRVPGWSKETDTLSITDVRFIPPGCSSVTITAMDTGGVGVAGIRVNGDWQAGNPVTYEIPTGTKHLKIQAEDMNGDRSAVVIRRIPGWSEVVTTLTVTDVTFTDYNTTAKITATATGGDSVAGVIVNEKYIEGNPIIYTVPKGTETLHIQAYNPQGDKSPMINKAVPPDASKSTLKLSIEPPDWTKARSAKVKLVAADQNRITKILVRTSENNEWADVTEKRYIEITADTTVYASIENDKGEAKEVSEDIECFDRKSPKVTATQDGRTVNIRASDDKSGVTSILVNNKEYSREDIEGGSLSYRVPEGTAVVTIRAEDAAGNLSSTVELPQNTTLAVLPTIVAPTPSPTPSGELVPEVVEIPEPTMIPLATPAPGETEEIPPEPTAAATPPSEQLPPAAKAAVAVGGLGIPSISGAWYWLRKKALSKPIEELELMGKKLLYDESEFGGSADPLDKKKGE